jgi:hypothetical protein
VNDAHDNAADDKAMLEKFQVHSATGVCTLAPERPRADVGLCRACIEQGLFDALMNAESPRRCQVSLIHRDKSREQCQLNREHVESDSDHVDQHGCKAPVLIRQATIRQAEVIAAERRAECMGTVPHGPHEFNGGMHCPGLTHPRFEPVLPAPDGDPERKSFEVRPATPASRTADTDEHILFTHQPYNNGNHREGYTTSELEDLYWTLGEYLGKI